MPLERQRLLKRNTLKVTPYHQWLIIVMVRIIMSLACVSWWFYQRETTATFIMISRKSHRWEFFASVSECQWCVFLERAVTSRIDFARTEIDVSLFGKKTSDFASSNNFGKTERGTPRFEHISACAAWVSCQLVFSLARAWKALHCVLGSQRMPDYHV